ncbi:MAG: autotransporter domain-containing protein [Rhodanobacteraceae bacterium]
MATAVLAGLAVATMTFSLAACGGGGGNGMVKTPPATPSPPSPPPPPPPPVSPPPPPPSTPYDSHNNQLIPTSVAPAQTAGFTGKGVKVGIMDSGVDPSDPALNASDATGRNKVAWFQSYVSGGSSSPNDNFGHGTVTAQLIAGDPYSNSAAAVQFNGGVAPGADLYVAQVCSGYGTLAGETCNPTAQAYTDLIAQGVRVISEGFGVGGDVTKLTATDSAAAQVYALLKPVATADVLQIFGTGDSAAQANPSVNAGLPYLFPDMKGYIIAVAGVDIDTNGNPAGLYKESHGGTPCGVAADWCLSAPAEVWTVPAEPAFGSGHPIGSSTASAIVTGVAAQVLQAFPGMSAPNLTDTILTTATPLDDGSGTTPNPTFGWGMVDAAKAVKGPAEFAPIDFDANIPSSTTWTFANDISGIGSLTLSGPGTLMLSGSDTYTGGTTINNGVLQAVHALPGKVTVASGGMLDGVPGVTGDLANAGRVAVHGGKTKVAGNYSQTSTGTLAVSLGSALVVTGSATLSGKLEVTGQDSGYTAGGDTNVLTATGGIVGQFDPTLVQDTGVMFVDTTIHYDLSHGVVYLNTAGLSISTTATSLGIVDPASVGAAQRVQLGFDSINTAQASGNTVATGVLEGAGAIQHSPTVQNAHATLQSLSGQLHAASAAMLFDSITASDQALSEHFVDLLNGSAHSGIWYSSLGWQGNLQRSGYAGATFSSSGGVAGADMRIGSHAFLGVAAGQSLGFGQLDASWNHNRTWTNHLAVYGGVTKGPWYASAQVAQGWYREDMQRLLQLGRLNAPVGTGFTGRFLASSLEGGYRMHAGRLNITPFVDLRYQRLDMGAFAEQGGLGFGLKADGREVGRVQTGFGLRALRGWRLDDGMRVRLDASASWQHALHQYGDVFDASFTGFDNWLPVTGVGLARDISTLRTGLSLWPTHGFGLRLGYMREQAQNQHAGSWMFQGAVEF